MTPEFARLVTPIFLCVLDLEAKLHRNQPVSLEAERDRIRGELAEAEQEARRDGNPVKFADFELARRALIYWADEILIAVEPTWQNITLEFESFQEQNRAVRFYEFGERDARLAHPDVVETWFLALALGFEGDIVSAFRHHLNREPPGATDDGRRSRAIWAGDLYRTDRLSPVGRGPDPRPVEPRVPILRGGGLVKLALQLLTLTALIGAGLAIYDKFR